MAAIAHGWRPSKGSVARIPVEVAKEFHAADKAQARKRVVKALAAR